MDISAQCINYDERLGRVTAYIYTHLDDELDLNTLAEVAYLSPYHFHRIYRAARGETIATTVRRLRLHRAASQLAQSSVPVEDISRQAGYKNVQSFTRSFNATYGMPPARYRSHGNHTQYPSQHSDRSLAMYNVTLKTIPDLEVVSIKHQGAYNKIGPAYDLLFGWLGKRGLVDAQTRVLSIGYDDPATVPENELRSRACATVSKSCTLEAPLERVIIEGGRYAILRYKGPYDALPAIYQWLFGTWLLQSGCELRDAPPFEEYLNTPLDTAPAELLTDIYIPLA
ncbi:MAG: AraC family transcriptional regulator [Gallionella sp.]|nr:AraC family transcriptional regulator [Gallionella sp.]